MTGDNEKNINRKQQPVCRRYYNYDDIHGLDLPETPPVVNNLPAYIPLRKNRLFKLSPLKEDTPAGFGLDTKTSKTNPSSKSTGIEPLTNHESILKRSGSMEDNSSTSSSRLVPQLSVDGQIMNVTDQPYRRRSVSYPGDYVTPSSTGVTPSNTPPVTPNVTPINTPNPTPPVSPKGIKKLFGRFGLEPDQPRSGSISDANRKWFGIGSLFEGTSSSTDRPVMYRANVENAEEIKTFENQLKAYPLPNEPGFFHQKEDSLFLRSVPKSASTKPSMHVQYRDVNSFAPNTF